ncbi:MAG: hypothetical protein IPJ71_16795 [Bdellovibrionales bacterium]|nr:hypothetical protein [Bdellovibrionales bacterium]
MKGSELLKAIAEATGLPTNLILSELKKLVQKEHDPIEQLTLDDLREVLADYLQDILTEAKNTSR